jgi:hypothetical protein
MLKNKFITVAVVAIVLFLGMFMTAHMTHASNVNFDTDTTVTFENTSIDLIIATGSKADNLINDGTNLKVVIGNGDVFTVRSSDGNRVSVKGNTSATVDYSCSTVTITGGASGETITLFPTGTSCGSPGGGGSGSGGGSGGGGGGGGNGTTTPQGPPAGTPPADCRVGDLFSHLTGASCHNNLGCQPGFSFSPLNGQPCPSSPPPFANASFNRNLTIGSRGGDVLALQIYLNAHGFLLASSGPGSPGMETSFFGKLTKSALAKFQAANGIQPSVGFFGPITRAFVLSHP